MFNPDSLNLDVDSPDKVPGVLRKAAESFYASADDVAAAWQDEKVGRVWIELAKILEATAVKAEKAVDKYTYARLP
jgi:hypothetical protein